jgi:hypothetical protein
VKKFIFIEFLNMKKIFIFALFFLLVAAMVTGAFFLYNRWFSVDEDVSFQSGEENEALQDKNPTAPADDLKTAAQTSASGPYYHSIFFGTGASLDEWSLDSEALAEHASVPDLIFLNQPVGSWPAGTLATYFVDARAMVSGGQEEIGLLFSFDRGQSWSDLSDITISGVTDDILPVDPSVVQLNDGRLRLYFLDLPQPEESESGSTCFYSAVSTDGKNFVLEDKVFESATLVTDPEVVYFNQQWLMYYVDGQRVGLAISDDGLNFIADGPAGDLSGIPGAIVIDDQLSIFGCGNQVDYSTSSDGKIFGLRQAAEGLGNRTGQYFYCDPGPVLLDDGSLAIILKRTTLSGSSGTSAAGIKRPPGNGPARR